jgi:hypothetical protein
MASVAKPDAIMAVTGGDSPPDRAVLDQSIQKFLYAAAQAKNAKSQYRFRRFELLVIYDLLLYQAELTKFDEQLQNSRGVMDTKDLGAMRSAMKEYRSCPYGEMLA